MKRVTIIAGAVAILLEGAGAAWAAVIDFEPPTYSTGAIEGQDNWEPAIGPNADAGIIALSGPGGSTQVLGSLNTNRGHARRSQTDTILLDNTMVSDWMVRTGQNSEVAMIRAYAFTGDITGPGVGDSGGASSRKFRLYTATGGAYDSTAIMADDHWYRVTVAISVESNTATLSAYDLTAGAPVTGMGLDNKAMSIPGADTAARQAWLDALDSAYISFGGGAPRADNIMFNGRPEINNADGATNVTPTRACLNGNLLFTGGGATDVWTFWGTGDGVTTKTSWAFCTNLGVCSTGAFTKLVTHLQPGSKYYYRCYATNAFADGWATNSAEFTTLPAAGTVLSVW